MKHLLLPLLALCSVSDALVSYKDYKVYKIVPETTQAVTALYDLELQDTPYEFWKGVTKIGEEVVLLAPPDAQEMLKETLDELEIGYTVTIENVQALIDAEKRVGPQAVDWTGYNTLEEINEWLEEVAVEFPEEVTVLKPGKSHLGRDVVGVKLDKNPSESNKQVVFVEANIHAREWITSAVATYILDQFLRNSSLATFTEKYTWYFFPVTNPDGFAYSHTDDRMWRKTRTRYSIFCYGADPNRNWGYKWMYGGASQNPCSNVYAGPTPFSEPSVQVLKTFIESVADNMVAYISFHSFSQMLLLPYGHTTDPLDNYEEMMEIGEIAMEQLRLVHGTEYVWGNIAETLYIMSGSSVDWVKSTFHTPVTVMYELRDRGQYGFLLPSDQILPTAEETLVSVQSIFEQYEQRHLEKK